MRSLGILLFLLSKSENIRKRGLSQLIVKDLFFISYKERNLEGLFFAVPIFSMFRQSQNGIILSVAVKKVGSI